MSHLQAFRDKAICVPPGDNPSISDDEEKVDSDQLQEEDYASDEEGLAELLNNLPATLEDPAKYKVKLFNPNSTW